MHTHPLRWGRTSDSLTHIPKTALWISLQDTELHTDTHMCEASVCWPKKQPNAAVTRLHAPLNSMTHFSQLGLAGRARSCTLPWIIGTARWMWGEWLKTGDPSPPPRSFPSPASAVVSWLRTSSSHTSSVLESVLLTPGRQTGSDGTDEDVWKVESKRCFNHQDHRDQQAASAVNVPPPPAYFSYSIPPSSPRSGAPSPFWTQVPSNDPSFHLGGMEGDGGGRDEGWGTPVSTPVPVLLSWKIWSPTQSVRAIMSVTGPLNPHSYIY